VPTNGDTQEVDALVPLLGDPRADVAAEAHVALRKLLERSPGQVADALADLGDRRALGVLFSLVNHPSWDVVWEAAIALAKLATETDAAHVASFLQRSRLRNPIEFDRGQYDVDTADELFARFGYRCRVRRAKRHYERFETEIAIDPTEEYAPMGGHVYDRWTLEGGVFHETRVHYGWVEDRPATLQVVRRAGVLVVGRRLWRRLRRAEWRERRSRR
jgi:hypothetical protein